MNVPPTPTGPTDAEVELLYDMLVTFTTEYEYGRQQAGMSHEVWQGRPERREIREGLAKVLARRATAPAGGLSDELRKTARTVLHFWNTNELTADERGNKGAVKEAIEQLRLALAAPAVGRREEEHRDEALAGGLEAYLKQIETMVYGIRMVESLRQQPRPGGAGV